MTHVNDIAVRDSLKGYFRSLAEVGHVPERDVMGLLVQMFVNELLNGEFGWFVSDGDYRAIRELLFSVSGTCLVPYAGFCADRIAIGRHTAVDAGSLRITEAGSLRSATDGRPRVAERRHDSGGFGGVRVTEDRELRTGEAGDGIRITENGDI